VNWLRRILALVGLGIVLYLFWPLVGELRQAAALFQQVHWGWLGAAMLLQLISYTCLTTLNYFLLHPFSGKVSFWRLEGILLAIAFVEVGLPSGGMSGIVLRGRLLGHSGYSIEVSAFTLALEMIHLSVVMSVISLFGFWYLVRIGNMSSAQSVLLAGLMAVIFALGAMVVWAGRDRRRARYWSQKLVSRWNRLAPKTSHVSYSPEKIMARIDSFYDGLAHLKWTPRWPFWLAATGRVALDVATLNACFTAFSYVISPSILLTGYGLMQLLSGLAALPGGLGAADASLAVIYARLGAPGAVAVAASLTYRLIAFWLLRFAGFICWLILEEKP
jgi:uncharacterized protein (TIRG00374 family)